MPKLMRRAALAAGFLMAAELLTGAGCTAPPVYRPYEPALQTQASGDIQMAQLASGLGGSATEVLSAPPGTCGPAAAPVVRIVLPEQVLFATASDQPGPNAPATLEDIAGKIIQQAPDTELTVLGHTDAVGSDAYNMDLSKRRALAVLRGLAMRGLDPRRLSAVAIGKRQPIADDATPEGRARNRRVEFLLSSCMAANLRAVADASRAALDIDNTANRPVEVLRLDPSSAYGVATVSTLSLKPLQSDQPVPAAVLTAPSAQPYAVAPPAVVARPAPAPHYQPRPLLPDVQPNPLGPAVPF